MNSEFAPVVYKIALEVFIFWLFCVGALYLVALGEIYCNGNLILRKYGDLLPKILVCSTCSILQ